VFDFGGDDFVAVEAAGATVGVAGLIDGAEQVVLVFVSAAFGERVGFVAYFACPEVVEFGTVLGAAFGLGEQALVEVEVVAYARDAGHRLV
jgi:hypothetical protein